MKGISNKIRKRIIEMANRSGSPHVGSCLSTVDILTVLYFKTLKLEPWEDRDVFIMSKGHAAMALYSTLCEKSIFSEDLIKGYFQNNGTLPAHLDRFVGKGVEVSAGALGHGFNVGLGLVYGFKKQKIDRKVFVIIGDGESQEGSIWEGAMFAPKMGLNNFTAFLDYNNLQGYGSATEICQYEPIGEKWKSFGWDVFEIDGHNHKEIENALKEKRTKPKVIISKTIKGKGVSFMENKLEWHYYIVTDELKEQALKELK